MSLNDFLLFLFLKVCTSCRSGITITVITVISLVAHKLH